MGKNFKRFLAVCLCLVIPVFFCSCGDKHKEHTYSSEWSSNDTHHWHKCTYEGCAEQGSKAEHNWDSGTDSGHNIVYTCTDCQKTKEEPKNHIPVTSEWVKDETHHWHACLISGCTEKLDKSEHDWDSGETSGHTTVYTCLTCGQTKEEGSKCVASDTWEKDDRYHWHTCTIEGCTELVDKASHDWVQGKDEGHFTNYACSICGQTKKEERSCMADLSVWGMDDENHWHPCSIVGCDKIVSSNPHNFVDTNEDDGHFHVYKCTECDKTKNVRRECEADLYWQKDTKHHWHNCAIDGTCTEQLDKDEHTWDDGKMVGNEKVFACTVCGQTRKECGNCSYEITWSKDEKYHWHNCSTKDCTGFSDKTEHDWCDNPTFVNHKNLFTCETCGQTKEEDVPCDFTDAKWQKDETHHWHICIIDGCTKTDKKVAHEFGTPTLVGHINKYTCECGQIKEETVPCNFGTEWSKDETHHWHTCTIDGCTEISNFKEHNWSKTPTLVNHKNVYTCETCGQTREEVVPCNFVGAKWETDGDYHWHKCTVDGCSEIDTKLIHKFGEPEIIIYDKKHDNMYVCECGYKKYENIPHTYEWDKGNNTNHWQVCVVEGCEEQKDHGFHNWSTPIVSEHNNHYSCPTCNATKVEVIPCDFEETWSYDNTYHYHKCKIDGCVEVKDKAEHNMGEKYIDGDATITPCKTCDYKIYEWSNIYIRGLEQLVYNPYKIVVKDFKLNTGVKQELLFNELHLGLNEKEEVIGYGYCELTEPDKNNTLFGLIGVIKENTLYIINSFNGDKTAVIAEVNDVETFINNSLNMVGGKEGVKGMLLQMQTTFDQEITYIYTKLIEIYNDRLGADDALRQVYEYLYDVEEVDGVYVYSLNFESLKKINDFLEAKTIAEIIDLKFGDGAFETITEFLKNSVDLTVAEWVTLLEDNGIKVNAVLDYLDDLSNRLFSFIGSFIPQEDTAPDDNMGALNVEENPEEPEEMVITFELILSMITKYNIPDISELLKDEEFTKLTVVQVINKFMAENQNNKEETNETPNIEENGGATSEEEFKELSSDEIKEEISNYIDLFTPMTVYDAVEWVKAQIEEFKKPENPMVGILNVNSNNSGENQEPVNTQIYVMIKDILEFAEQVATVKLTTGLDGTIESLSIVLNAGEFFAGTIEIVKSGDTLLTEVYDEIANQVTSMKSVVESFVVTEDALPFLDELAKEFPSFEDYLESKKTESLANYIFETTTEDGYTINTYTNADETIRDDGYIYKCYNIYTFVYDSNNNFVSYNYAYYYQYRRDSESKTRETIETETLEKVVDEFGNITLRYETLNNDKDTEGYIRTNYSLNELVVDKNNNFLNYNYASLYEEGDKDEPTRNIVESKVFTKTTNETTGEVSYKFDFIKSDEKTNGYLRVNNKSYEILFNKDGKFSKYNYNREYKDREDEKSELVERYEEFLIDNISTDIPVAMIFGCDGWVTLNYLDVNNFMTIMEVVTNTNGETTQKVTMVPTDFSILVNIKTGESIINLFDDYFDFIYCHREEVVKDRLKTDYGYLIHYVCTDCGSECYEQVPFILDYNDSQRVNESYDTYVKNFQNNSLEYYEKSELLFKNDKFIYQYDTENYNWVMVELSNEDINKLEFVTGANGGSFYVISNQEEVA